jgi:hypothetical protein
LANGYHKKSQNLFLLCGAGSKLVHCQVLFLLEHILTLTRGWFPRRFILAGLSRLINRLSITNHNRIKICYLGLCRFEACRRHQFFSLSEHTLTFSHGWFRSVVHITSLSQVEQSQNLCLLELVRNLLTTFLWSTERLELPCRSDPPRHV